MRLPPRQPVQVRFDDLPQLRLLRDQRGRRVDPPDVELVAERLVACVDAFVGLLERVFVIRQVAGAAPFVLVPVDEPDRLTRRPALVVYVQGPHDALDQAQLIVRVQNLEVLRQPGLLPVHAQQAVGDAVEGAHPKRRDRHAEQRLDALAHLRRRLVGEGDRQQAVGGDAFGLDHPSDAMHQHPGLAAAGAGHHQCVAQGRGHRLALRVVEAGNDVGDVHGCG